MDAQGGERAGERCSSADPACRDCRHYWITHDMQHPWGCRAWGFKGARPPAQVVREATGLPCQQFEPKQRSAR